jgi:predicted ribosomally synthesized peptide with SipW-like signal peptide
MKKKIVAIALVACLALTVIAGATLAYFTDKTEVEKNVFTVGNVDIILTEPKWDAEGSEDAPQVYPGEKLAKDPTVENVGANPCFVRIKVTGLDCLAPAGLITLKTDYVDGISAEWVEYEGYYYYYKDGCGVLAAGVKTDALFDQIVIPTDLKNGDAQTEFHVDVYAEAVQAQGAKDPNWAAVQGMTVAEIAAWFATCGM